MAHQLLGSSDLVPSHTKGDPFGSGFGDADLGQDGPAMPPPASDRARITIGAKAVMKTPRERPAIGGYKVWSRAWTELCAPHAGCSAP